MKKFRGLLSAVLVVTVMCSLFIPVSAKSFNDVDAKKYAWCTNEISKMADAGIISGYTDGSFKPERTVSKLEALALVARVLGSRDEVNAALLEKAKELYSEKIEDYKLSFGADEICYLLLKGVIFESELDDYLESANEGMKRYEMAVLLTKAMGAEEEVKEKVTAVLDYSDTLKIPASARKYVEYVTGVGLMQGMDKEANTFVPLNNVTRAQSAVVLYKLRDLTGYTTFSGVVAAYDKGARTIRIKLADDSNKAYTIIPQSVALRCDGKAINPDDIKVGWTATVTIKDDMLNAIDFLSAQSEGTVSGKLISIVRANDEITLKVQQITANDTQTVSYKADENVVVTYNDKEGNISDLETGDYVKLTIKDSKITVINGAESKKTVKGTITSIDLENGVTFNVLVNGEEENYFAADNAKVARNGKTAKISDLLVGDKVTLKLEYNIINSVEATSINKSDVGIIVGINITANPTVTIKFENKTAEYILARDAEINLDGKKGTIYDLRLNANATISTESDCIVKISSAPVEEITQVKGEVIAVNTGYNLIQLRYIDEGSGAEHVESVFVKSGAKIISISSSTDKKLKDVNEGQIITAMGSRHTGVFEATTIVIMN